MLLFISYPVYGTYLEQNTTGISGGSVVKSPPAYAGDVCLISGLERSLGKGNGKPTPVLLPAESHGQRSLVSYSPWGCKRIGHVLVIKQQQRHYYRF